jgi:Phage tail tube protein
MPTPVPRWLSFIGAGKEGSWNTPAVAATFFPLLPASKHKPMVEPIEDDGYRGTAARVQGWYQGVGWSEVDWGDLSFYPDDSGILLMGMLGVDTVTGTNPFTHTMTLLNTAFPPSYTCVRFTNLVATAEQVAGVYWEELTFKFVATGTAGRLTVSPKGRGTIQGTVTKPTNTYSAQQLVLGWQGALTLASVANAKLLTGTISLKRTVSMLFAAANSQNANGANVDQIDVSGTLEFYPTDMTEMNFYLNNTQPSASFLFTSGANTLTLQMSKTAWKSPTELDAGTPYYRLRSSFTAVANATDAGTGNSPLKAILVNPRAVTY